MTANRRARLWRLVADVAGATEISIEHACGAAIRAVGVDGAAIAVALRSSPREALYASDPVASELEELSLTLGEGPCVDAFADGPALAADLTAAECESRWPAFAPAAVAAGARAIFALPLQIGGIHLGSMDLYRARAGALDRDQVADALVLADTACTLLLDGQMSRPGDSFPAGSRWLAHPDPGHSEVHQATGMIMVQLGVTAAVALIRLRAYAFAHERHLRDVAADIVARRLRLASDHDGDSR